MKLLKELSNAELEQLSNIIKSDDFKTFERLMKLHIEYYKETLINRMQIESNSNLEFFGQGTLKGRYAIVKKISRIGHHVEKEVELRRKKEDVDNKTKN